MHVVAVVVVVAYIYSRIDAVHSAQQVGPVAHLIEIIIIIIIERN
jgi:hypothetical protein